MTLASDRPQGNLIVRLGDVAPDGAVTRITLGMLNLCHRGDHETPRPLTPGAAVTVAVPLDQMAYRLAAGHRLGLSLSMQYWSFIWPSPAALTLTVEVAGAVLYLPVREPGAAKPAGNVSTGGNRAATEPGGPPRRQHPPPGLH